ncbi:hypothetical protein EDD18DRAFT_1156586 [Armillaria luteobubalina]|uniref:Aminoglycoside phosphotransferase domain-containing protein n=1 Tax=Armillaria luteobubalina TaxID=153913 RepID=A0AA39QAJ2_9AGAR|nr:hypothetical protein EDD18DRAFT_1156586 [Armillaria luteobubalina]
MKLLSLPSSMLKACKVGVWWLWLHFPACIRYIVYDSIINWSFRLTFGDTKDPFCRPLGLPVRFEYIFEDAPSSEIEAKNLKFVRENTSIPGIPDVDVVPAPFWISCLLGMVLLKEPKLEGVVTLHDWLRSRTLYPPEYYHYMSLVFSPPNLRGMRSCEELSDLALSFDRPFLDLSDSPPLIEDLRKALTELRSIIPPTYYEVTGAYGSPLIFERFGEGRRHILPPFINVRSFHERLLGEVAMESHYNVRKRIIRCHRVCFSHSNLSRQNILVTRDGRLAAITNWEAAGWYPDYWDYALVDKPASLAEARVLNQFWTAVGVFGEGRYNENPEHYSDQ